MTQGTRLMNHKIRLPMLKTSLIKVKLQIYVNTCLLFNVTQKRMNYDGSLPKKGMEYWTEEQKSIQEMFRLVLVFDMCICQS